MRAIGSFVDSWVILIEFAQQPRAPENKHPTSKVIRAFATHVALNKAAVKLVLIGKQ